jgi:diadenosine tetraphosphate (Ap4A) HIT family hydrolase
MTFIMDLPASRIYLYKKNSDFPGRCIVSLDSHETELFNLDEKNRHNFVDSVSRVAKAVHTATGADKINYAVYGDTVSHLHVHIVPKHKSGLDWNIPFAVSRDDKTSEMTGREIESWIGKIKVLLKGK